MATPKREETCIFPSIEDRQDLREQINTFINDCISNNSKLNDNNQLGIKIAISIVCPGQDNIFTPGSNDPYEEIEIKIGSPGNIGVPRGLPIFPIINPETRKLDPFNDNSEDASKDSAIEKYIEILKKRIDRLSKKKCPNPQLVVGVQCYTKNGAGTYPISRNYTNPIILTPKIVDYTNLTPAE